MQKNCYNNKSAEFASCIVEIFPSMQACQYIQAWRGVPDRRLALRTHQATGQ